MARARMLARDASTDPQLNSISPEAQLLYILSIPYLDRDGLITGEPILLWAQCAPRRIALMDKAHSIIDEWASIGLVIRKTPVSMSDTAPHPTGGDPTSPGQIALSLYPNLPKIKQRRTNQ